MIFEKAAESTGVLRRIGSLGVRTACVGLVLGLGWYSLLTFHQVLRGPNSPVPVPPLQPSPLERLMAAGNGGWQLGGQPFLTKTTQCRTQELLGVLTQTASGVTPAAPLEEAHRKLVHAAATARARWERGWVYLLDAQELKVALVTEEHARDERWLAVRIATNNNGLTWTVTEITPQGNAANARQASLLPLPAAAQVMARRLDERGKPCVELVQRTQSANELRAFWEQQGWQVKGNALSDGWLCRQGNEAVQVWVPGLASAQDNIYFAIRVEP